MRRAGKYGCRRPKRAKSLPWADIRDQLPATPSYSDYLVKLGGGWQMLGNDQAGDCVAVTWANYRRMVTSLLTSTPNYPSQDQVWQFYQTQNPGFDPNGSADVNGPGSSDDGGMDIQTALEYLHQTGGPDGTKVSFFASVDYTKPDEVQSALAVCGGLWTGINVYANNQTEFADEVPWTFQAGQQNPGGHSVLTGGYGSVPGEGAILSGDEKFITWAEETSFTDGFWTNCVSQCWAVIWPEQLNTREFEQGVDLNQLEQVYEEVTGQQLSLP